MLKSIEKRCEEYGDFEPLHALDFAIKHDWGTSAYLEERTGGLFMLCGVLHTTWSEIDQRWLKVAVCFPATMDNVKKFGGYGGLL